MKKTRQLVVAALCAVMAFAAQAVSWTTDASKAIATGTGTGRDGSTGLTYNTSGVTPGAWTSDFAAAKAYADTYHIPMLMFYGSTSCGFCDLMEEAMQRATFTNWMKSHPSIFVFVEVASPSGSTTEGAFALNRSGLTQLPIMRTYWKKADGTVAGKSFTGRSKTMGSDATGSSLEAKLVSRCTIDFAGWDGKLPSNEPDYAGGYFSVTNLPNSRLEAVVNKTASVAIPLYRTAKTAASNKLQVGSAAQVTVSWAANETSKTYTHTLTAAEKSKTGAIALRLYDSDGTTLKSSSAINVVSEPATSVTNPKWVGESFDYGEWTMDYEAAKKKDGYVLVNFSGVLWCPYCAGAEKSLIASAKFTNWAKQNKVSLVLFDQSRASDPATAAGNGTARLLSYAEGNSTPLGGLASGAAYLSRKGIGASAAKTVIDRVTKYTAQWLPPGSTAARLGNPTFLLVKNDQVMARVSLYHDGDKVYDVDENIARLNDALLLANDGEANDYLQSTTQTLAPNETKRTTLQVNDAAEWYRLTGLKAGAWKFTATADKSVTVTVYSSTNAVATGTGSVTATLTAAQAAATCYVQLSAYDNATSTKYAAANGTSFTAGITFANVPIPGTIQFATTSATKLEADGSGTISVTRTGGSNGRAVATVSVNKGSNGTGRVSVSPATLTWADGETAAKTVTYRIAANSSLDADETFTITLAAGSGNTATIGANRTFALKVTDTSDPVLPATSYALRLYRGFAVNQSYAVSNIKGTGRVTMNKSGALPGGLKVKYDAASKKVTLTGKATRAGTFTAKISVTEARTDGRATGAATTFTFTVVDPASLTAGAAGYNAVIAKNAKALGTIPVYGKTGGRTVLAGTLDFTLTTAYRVTAKYFGVDGTKTLFTGALDSLTSAGVASATMTKGSATAKVSIASNGRATVTLTGMGGGYGSSLASEAAGWNLNTSPSAYRGYYVVTLPVDASASALKARGETLATGTGYVILKANTAAFQRTGKVSYQGMLANGQTFTGTAYLSGDQTTQGGATWAYLPITVLNKRGNQAGVVLRIRKNAAGTYETDPEVVFAADSAKPFWTNGGRTYFLNAYGDYYDTTSATLTECCEQFYEKTTFHSAFLTSYFASGAYGTVSRVPSSTATVDDSGKFTIVNANAANPLKLTLKKNTGVVTGTAQVTFSNGRTVRLNIYGVLLLGWADCGCSLLETPIVERPLFSGTAVYKDGATMRGFAVELQ